MAEGKSTRLTYEQMAERIQRGETVILEDGSRARSLSDLPAPTPIDPIPIITPPAGKPANPPAPEDPDKPKEDGLDKLTKAELIEIATKEGSEPKAGTNDEIREGIRAKRKETSS